MREQAHPKAFSYQGLMIDVDPRVYDPAEDTFLLLENIHPRPQEAVLELGTGCGIIALACAHAGARVVASDCNPHAVENCRQNLIRNQSRIIGIMDVRLGDLFTVVRPRERFDLIVFNPPYVPTPAGELLDQWLDLATSGGAGGLAVTGRFLKDVGRFFTANARAYTIISSRSPPEVVTTLFRQGRLTGTIVGRQWFAAEEIICYCLASAD